MGVCTKGLGCGLLPCLPWPRERPRRVVDTGWRLVPSLCVPFRCSGRKQLRDRVPSAALAKRTSLLFMCQAFGGDNSTACFAFSWAGHESWLDYCGSLGRSREEPGGK